MTYEEGKSPPAILRISTTKDMCPLKHTGERLKYIINFLNFLGLDSMVNVIRKKIMELKKRSKSFKGPVQT